jgi:hypothetical protein
MVKPQLWQGFRGPAAGDGEQLTPHGGPPSVW